MVFILSLDFYSLASEIVERQPFGYSVVPTNTMEQKSLSTKDSYSDFQQMLKMFRQKQIQRGLGDQEIVTHKSFFPEMGKTKPFINRPCPLLHLHLSTLKTGD